MLRDVSDWPLKQPNVDCGEFGDRDRIFASLKSDYHAGLGIGDGALIADERRDDDGRGRRQMMRL